MKSVWKITAACIILVLLALSGCNTNDIPVTGISLDASSVVVVVGGVTLLNATIEPAEATNTEVSWSCSDESCAVVSESGIVIGMGEGTATITAMTDDGGLTASCEVTVGTVSVTGVLISPANMYLEVGEIGQLEVFLNPWNSTNRGVSWESSNAVIASVDEIGLVSGNWAGDTTVTVTTSNGGHTAASTVSVRWVPGTGNTNSHQKISDTEGDFAGTLENDDYFGSSVTSPGDLNGDGVADLVVGVYGDDDGGSNRGAVWVLFFNSDGTVASHQKISDTEGGFAGILDDSDRFGWSVTSPGDLDSDGVADFVVGAIFDDDGGTNRGAVWVLFLNRDGTVSAFQKISDTEGGFTGILADGDQFGSSVTSPGDLNGDGVPDLVVGAHRDADGGSYNGAVWVLFLNSDGTVASHQKISATEGSFTGTLDGDYFGCSVTSPGDLNGDGVVDVVVGAYKTDGGIFEKGAVWVLFLNSDGTVASHQKISNTEGDFTGTLDDGDYFGSSVTSLGDLNGDGVADVVVGANGDADSGSYDNGAVWVLYLNSDGTVASHQKISATEGGFTGTLDDYDYFGSSVTSPGDLNGDGVPDLAVGAYLDDDGGSARGAVWVLFMEEK